MTSTLTRSPQWSRLAVACGMSLGLLACGGSDDEAAQGFTVGGTISGLSSAGLVLQNNGADDLTLPAGAADFVFSAPLAVDQSYSVSVKTQPSGLSCAVSHGQGMVEADVRDVQVSCSPEATGGGGGTGPGGGDGDAGGDGGSGDGDGSGGDGGTRTGAASDCFNPALATPGTRYRWHMLTQVEGQRVSMVQERQIAGGGSFAGASGLLVDQGTMVTQLGDVGAMNQDVVSYFQLRNTDAGPVIVDHGGSANSSMTIAGMKFDSQMEYVNTPPAEKREFTLQPGQSYQFSATSRTSITIPGSGTTIDTSTESYQVTYLGQKQITVAAGTYLACHFTNTTAEGTVDVYHSVGSGLPLVMASKLEDAGTVRMEMQPDSHVNGVPVSQYHGSRQ